MKKLAAIISICTLLLTAVTFAFNTDDNRFITYTTGADKISMYWKDKNGFALRSIAGLKKYVDDQQEDLLFAMNGGMYKTDNSPLGLYVENGQTFMPLNEAKEPGVTGNFYMKPNGVFYITMKNQAVICKTEQFDKKAKIKYATQSGPMLLIEGHIHPAFKRGSKNLNIRNGVGILPDGKVLFAMSKEGINFYDFALYFKSMGCMNALYLDGYVSRTYLPEKNWVQTDGNFGVMIGVTK